MEFTFIKLLNEVHSNYEMTKKHALKFLKHL